MIYDRTKQGYSDGQWHCPFSPECLERKARAAKCCKLLTAKEIEAAIFRIENSWQYYKLPPSDFLDEPQDARGYPLSWLKEDDGRADCCTSIYDYGSIAELIVTNWEEDWPFRIRETIITA